MEKKKFKKVKLVITTSLISLTIVLVFLVVFYFIGRKQLDEINKIEVTVSHGYLSSTYTYEIDFTNNTVTHTSVAFNSNDSESFVSYFSKEDAEYFVKYANLYGFFNWKESYINDGDVQDGPQTNITIEYTNDLIQTVECFAEFPNTYDKMQEVFGEAFGYNML